MCIGTTPTGCQSTNTSLETFFPSRVDRSSSSYYSIVVTLIVRMIARNNTTTLLFLLALFLEVPCPHYMRCLQCGASGGCRSTTSSHGSLLVERSYPDVAFLRMMIWKRCFRSIRIIALLRGTLISVIILIVIFIMEDSQTVGVATINEKFFAIILQVITLTS